jgi:hypothetical protein
VYGEVSGWDRERMKENRRLTLNEYASKRGFTKQELQQYDIRLEGDVVVIPTLGRNGAWYEREHRPDGVPKYKTPQGETIHLYNPLGLGPNTDEVWIAEGEFDTLSLVVSGVPAVGLSGATSWNEKWWLLYARARVVLALDPDEEGKKQTGMIANWFYQMGNEVEVFDPSPYGDLNEWFVDDRAGFQRKVLEW